MVGPLGILGGTLDLDWFTKDRVGQMLGDDDYISHAIHTWHRDDIIRGKGKACRQSKEQFE